jgi:outer membrane protein assembly factor BamB
MGSDRSHTLKVIALDRASGEIRWSEVAYEGRVYDDRHQGASYASATAVTDGERAYFYFGSQGAYAYDFDGNQVWGIDLGDFSYFGVGLGTSPVLYDNVLILQIDDGEGAGSFIVGLDKKTGDELWRTPRAVEASWATPLLLDDVGGVPQLLTIGNQLLIAYDPLSGEELWQLDGLHNNAVHSPVWDGELVYVSAGYPRNVIRAVRPRRGGAEVVWEYRKGAAYVASNIVYGGYLYVTNDKGIITCLDAVTGEVVYAGGRVPVPPSMLMSSLLVVDDKIMMSTPEGDTFWITTGPEFSVDGHNSLDEPILSTPAIVEGTIYLRGRTHLYAIGSVDNEP